METRSMKIQSKANKSITMDVIPGHFATNHSHVNYYVDLSSIKTRHKMAKEVADLLCSKYFDTTAIDTIICLEGTEMIGAFLANALSQGGHVKMNSGKDINVITPEQNSNNQMIFRDNTQKIIYDKNVLLLMASASTGKTIDRSVECIEYYSGVLVGIAAIFSATREVKELPVNAIFTEKDIHNYKTFKPGECENCTKGRKLEAIINSYGYSKI